MSEISAITVVQRDLKSLILGTALVETRELSGTSAITAVRGDPKSPIPGTVLAEIKALSEIFATTAVRKEESSRGQNKKAAPRFAIVFTAVAFLIPFPKGGTFWIAYIAEIISFALQVPFFKTAFDGKEELKSKVLGFPIFRVGYIYLGTQTALSLAFFALGFVPGFPVWLTAVVCLIVLAGGLVCGISADIAHEEVTKMETVMKPDTGFMKSLCAKM